MGKLDNAKALYLEGIRDGRAREAVERYTGDRYTQHSTGVADGVEGFVAFFDDFIARNPKREIDIVRGFEDGRYVFIHAFQSLNDGEAKWVTMDIFDTDEDDKIVEHWDVIQAWTDETVSGRSQIDGPTHVADLDRTEANKGRVREFVRVVLQEGRGDRVEEFLSAETYHQHNPQVGDGLEGLGVFLGQLAEEGLALRYIDVPILVGAGNFVATLSRAEMGDQELAIIDLFRLEAGMIVEHWDTIEPIPPREEWANSGKF